MNSLNGTGKQSSHRALRTIAAPGRWRLARQKRRSRASRQTAIAFRPSRFATWADAAAARYGQRLDGPLGPAMLPCNEKTRGGIVDARTAHLHVAQTWAPRLQLTLVTHVARPGGADDRRSAEAALKPDGSAPGWQLVRTALAAPASLLMTHARRAASHMEREAAAFSRRGLAERAESIDLVSASGPTVRVVAATGGDSSGDMPAVGMVVSTASPVARVFPKPSTAAQPDGVGPLHSPSLVAEPIASPRARAIQTPAPFEADPALIDRIGDRVIQQISHRIQSYRERTGRA